MDGKLRSLIETLIYAFTAIVIIALVFGFYSNETWMREQTIQKAVEKGLVVCYDDRYQVNFTKPDHCFIDKRISR